MPYTNYPQYPNIGYVSPSPYNVQPTYIPPAITPTQSQNSYIRGQVVKSHDDIQPGTIPMDGTISLFPTTDYKVIYGKQWNADGTITTIEYRPTVQQTPEHAQGSSEDLQTYLDRRFGQIEDMIKSQRNTYRRQNKKENSDGSSEVRA